ncbi:YihY/virulence factor BrkB family protein [Kineococcus terrestris]|uniref:YihY/virulence factor BrkB family protein n=1 Tax=Kineococcus terrestris TaxID=2044856 RepID=UPI0034DACA0A
MTGVEGRDGSDDGSRMAADRPRVLDRMEARAGRSGLRLAGRNPALVAVRVAQRFVEVRVAGLAAEAAYYLVVSLVPLVTMVGASLGLVRTVLGADVAEQVQATLAGAVRAVLSPGLADDVAVPLVEQLLAEEQVGVALTSLAVALFLGSRVFRAAVRTLGEAYRVPERRGLLALWGLGIVFTVAAVALTVSALVLVVVGPLLGGGQQLADELGARDLFERVWSLLRWPLLVGGLTAFLAWLYQVGQAAETRWRDALPGAVLATAGLLGIAVGFRAWVEVAGAQVPDVAGGTEAVQVAGQFTGVVLAALLLSWLTSAVVLTGGVVNAEWHAARPGSPRG